jgi:hypothetical protein
MVDRRRVVQLAIAVFTTSACTGSSGPSSPEPALASGGGALVDTAAPNVEPAIPAPIPSLGLHGKTFDAPLAWDAPFVVHEGTFSDGLDLSAPPHHVATTWIDDAALVPHASAPGFSAVLGQALDDGTGPLGLEKLEPGAMETAIDVLGLLGGSTEFTGPEALFLGYAPARARWLAARSFPANLRQATVVYDDPLAMANLRERGARLYCAAREAQNVHQSAATKAMGRQVGFSATLFGEQVDFLVVEPTLVLDGPFPYLGGTPRCPVDPSADCGATPSPHDGAQAFMIPLLFGTRVTPVSLLPSLPEVRYPVVLVAGDSEVRTPVFVPLSPLFRREYQTVTHAEAVLTAGAGGRAAGTIPLFQLGVVSVDLHLGLAMRLGQPFSGEAPSLCPSGTGDLPGYPATVAPANDRLLLGAPSGWPPARAGAMSTLGGFRFAEGPWQPSSFSADTLAPFFFTHVSSDPADPAIFGGLWFFDPLVVRALEDDDRHVWNSSTMQLCGGISATLGIDLGPVDVGLTAGGNLSGFVAQRHDLRSALIALQAAPPDGPQLVEYPALPMAALSVTPRTRASADMNLFVHLTLEIEIDLLLETVTITLFDDDLLNTGPINLASYDSGPWAEEHRLRLGTGSSFGDPMKQPVTLSHLPNGTLFASFPVGNDVDSCLADASPNVPAPTPCESTPPSSALPQVEVCAYAGGVGTPDDEPLPPNVCDDIDGFVAAALGGATPAQQACLRERFVFLCEPVSKQQTFLNQPVRARVLDFANPDLAGSLQNVVQICVDANVPPGAGEAAAEAYAQTIFSYGLCEPDATLIAGSSAVAPVGNPLQAPPVTPGQCL